MVEVLICDSDKGFVLLGREAVGKVAAKYQQEVWVENYLNGGELIHALAQKEDTKLCIVLLDIDMPELGSYNVAKILSEQFPEVLLLFVSAREELVYTAFEYHPFWFIRKSNFMAEICHALRRTFDLLECRIGKYIEISCGGENVLLAHSEIVYLLMCSRKILINLQDGRVIEARGTMKGMQERLANQKMIRINSGCIINADQVESFTSDKVTMKSGKKLPISRDRAKSVRIQIEKNWRKV